MIKHLYCYLKKGKILIMKVFFEKIVEFIDKKSKNMKLSFDDLLNIIE